MRVALLTAAAMLAFAANSILARLALATGDVDALGYTGIRFASGALVLGLILAIGRARRSVPLLAPAGSWAGAAALLGYGLAFSIAYLMLGAGTGALILFGSVQVAMLAAALGRGERPGALEWLGIAAALAALAYLVLPGLVSPPLGGAALMAAAGVSWAAYTLIGRGSSAPLADTAGNFARCLPVAAVLVGAGLLVRTPNPLGVAYAVASGALASGLGYAIWYTALPGLTRAHAAFVQLTVPAIAAAGGVLFIGEPLTGRLLAASAVVLGGVALALVGAQRRSRG